MKTFSFVKSIIFSFVLLSVFIFSCEKNKGYDNNLGIGVGIESISLIESENPEKGLVSDITCDIDTADYTVSLTVPHSAILTGLKFDIKLSEGYSISPASGDEVNFELEESSEESSETPSLQRYKKVFTLTAKDGTAKEYKVYITKGSSNECAISSFKFINDEKNNGKGLVKDITGIIIKSESGEATISLIVPNIADLADLKPTIEISSGATVSPANEEAKTFTSGSEEEYTVTAQDGRTKTYKVTVTKEEGPKLESFKIPADNNKGIRDEVTATFEHEQGSATGKILLNIPYTGTAIDLEGLTPTIEVPAGCSVDLLSGQAVTGDISSARFTLTKTDTGSKRVYTVEAVKGPYISSFKFETTSGGSTNTGISTTVNGVISHANNTIAITIPSTAAKGSSDNTVTLTPTIEFGDTTNTTITPSVTAQQFILGSEFNYKVTSNGIEKTYKVTVTKEAAPQLKSFTISANPTNGIQNNVEAVITDDSNAATGKILLKIPYTGTDINLTGLTPTITFPDGSSGYTVSPVSGTAVSVDISTTGSNTFTVTTTLGSKRVYTVTAVKGPYISKFEFKANANNANGITTDISATSIDHNTGAIAITVPSAVDLSQTLTPTITLGDDTTSTVEPAASAKVFNQSVQYTVKNSTHTDFSKVYIVTVTKEAAPVLSSFLINANSGKGIKTDVAAVITNDSNAATGKILLKIPYTGTDINLTGLTPTIEPNTGGYTVNPASGAAVTGDISTAGSNTVTLTKTDTGSKRVYTVEAVKGPSIKSFKFGNSGNTGITTEISATSINHDTGAITITVPGSVKKGSGGSSNTVTLTPTIDFGDANNTTITPSVTAQQFTLDSEFKYIVKNSTHIDLNKEYKITVTRTPSTEAQITKFEIESGAQDNIIHPSNSNGDKGRIVVPVSSLPTSSTSYTIEKSDYATVTPNEVETFSSYSESKQYTVTAENTSTQKTYEVYIYDSNNVIVPDSLKVANGSTEITPSSKVITENSRVIIITVPSGTSLTDLTLSLDSSSSSSYTLEPTNGQDFSDGKEVKYTLKENNDVKGYYWVKIAVAE
ncbi:DUF5018 domain-containing protein [Ichthyobacterium seriolicida]|uniref:Uncharacterized protein n=1 Tax=Ichthyobacterium seriolicida TaxID=242600 RepID=A0A1J1E0C2_9FLAO|nr:DUF5018 domain-containing protein [Ichthyobacterium seriolicida]BAV94381.1 hypothetical protein JBKA6_0368 [Ichthyobacterium seriolicida]